MEPNETPQPPVATPEPPAAAAEVKSWHEQVFTDEALKTNDSIKKYKTSDDFGKAFLEKDSMIGRKGVVLPKEGDEADLNRYYNDLGRPAKAEEYKNPEINVPDEYKQFYSEEKLNGFKNIAHKHGLTQKQFESLTKEYSEGQLRDIQGIVQAENNRKGEDKKALMNEWLLDYDANSKRAEQLMDSMAEKVPADKLDLIKSDPHLKKMFFNVAKIISDDSLKGGGVQPGDTTAQELQSFIDSQVKTNNSSFYNAQAPDHKATRAKVADCYEKLAQLRRNQQ